MRKPTVVFYNRVYPPARGATGRALRDLARAFARDGWDVTVVTTGPKALTERDGNVRVMRVKSSGKKSLFAYGLVWVRLLRAGMSLPRPDLMVTMTDPPLLVVAGRTIAKAKKCRHIHWCHDLYPDLLPALGVNLPRPISNWLRTLSRQAMRSCDKIVVVGRCMARHLTHSGVDPRRLTVIPNWPDAELVSDPGKARKGAARTGDERKILRPANGIRPHKDLVRDEEPKFRILYAGNLGRAHPLDDILGAAEILSTRHPEIEFVFVGDGPQFDWLAQERARRGLENIRLLPWQPAGRLRSLMESGDLHLVTMEEKAVGMLVPSKFYAALAVGRPCVLVGSAQSETGRVLQDFKAGTVVPQGHPKRLAATLRAYRMNGDMWFSTHEAALRAGRIFIPDESLSAWIERARDVANLPVRLKKRAA